MARRFLFADVFSEQQQIQAGHWIYDAIYILSEETGICPMLDSVPVSVSQIKMFLNNISYDKLSDSGKKIFDDIESYFSFKPLGLDFKYLYAGANFTFHPNIFYKSNDELDWTFASSWCKSDDSVVNNSGEDSEMGTSFLVFPLYLDVADIIAIESRPYFGKTLHGMAKKDFLAFNALNSQDNGFTDVKVGYGSIGHTFDKWGISFTAGKSGLQIGNTLTGSIIYNDTFSTDGYLQLSIYSNYVNYNIDMVQVDRSRYLYIHDLYVSPFKWCKVRLLEGTLVNGPWEFRYLNPAIMMHGYGGYHNYIKDRSEVEQKLYGESDYCAYFGAMFEFMPFKNFRTYLLYAQNEIQSIPELQDEEGRTYPDSLGIQLGCEYTLQDNKSNGFWRFFMEGIYTTPFLYVKQQKESTLFAEKDGSYSWIGTPFGPDCIAISTKAEYTRPSRWNVSLQYNFIAHGTNSFDLFSEKNKGTDENGDEFYYYSYYPQVKYRLHEYFPDYEGGATLDEAESIARTYALSGTVQFSNVLVLSGKFNVSKRFTLFSSISGLFIFNTKNKTNNFASGTEMLFSMEYTLL